MVQFKDEFFEGQERDGFYVEPMMKRVWAAQLEVLMAVDKVCRDNGLQYFLNWGTLLGAIRHKGFIPWDDDVDITMKREDYQKFCAVALEQLPQGYDIINIHRYADYDNMIARVVNGWNITVSPDRLNNFHNCPYAVGVDIDILDYKARDEEEDALQLQLVEIVLQSVGAVEEYERGELSGEEMRAFLSQIEALCNIKLDYSGNLKHQLRKLGDHLCMIYSESDADELQYVISRIVNRPYYHLPKEWYDQAIYVPFEGVVELPVPQGYEEILKMQFGENYMTPIRGGSGHNYPFYRSQEKILAKFLKENNIPGELFFINYD